jgi:tRNA threonylcarbamoyladenosine biosynthesis protein TsaE
VVDTLQLPDEQATRRLGALLARHCPWSMSGARCVFLSGELGAGKTTLAAALLQACGVQESVRSPTYALIETYPIDWRVAVHLDLYRLQTAGELEPLGLRDYLHDGALLLVEWPERAAALLPRPDLWVRLALESSGRRCAIAAHTPVGSRWLDAAALGPASRSEDM